MGQKTRFYTLKTIYQVIPDVNTVATDTLRANYQVIVGLLAYDVLFKTYDSCDNAALCGNSGVQREVCPTVALCYGLPSLPITVQMQPKPDIILESVLTRSRGLPSTVLFSR